MNSTPESNIENNHKIKKNTNNEKEILESAEKLKKLFSTETEEKFLSLITLLKNSNCKLNKCKIKTIAECSLLTEFIEKNKANCEIYNDTIQNLELIKKLVNKIDLLLSSWTLQKEQIKYSIFSDIEFINKYIISNITKNNLFPKSLKLERIIQILEDKSLNIIGKLTKFDRKIQKKIIENNFNLPLIKKIEDKYHIILPIKNPLWRIKWALHISVNQEDYSKEKIRNLIKLWEKAYIINILTDIISNHQIAKLHFDYLTGAFSRDVIEEKTKGLLEQVKTNWLNISYFIIDIDYFKHINDTYWHNVGDNVLKLLVSTIKKHIREIDMIGRCWWEEFVIILNHFHSELPSISKIENKLKFILKDFNEQLKDITTEKITISVWWILNIKKLIKKNPNLSQEELYKLADELLYKSKNNWRNQFHIITSEWEKSANILPEIKYNKWIKTILKTTIKKLFSLSN